MGLKDYVRIFRRHKLWILGWFLLITAGYLFYDKYIKEVSFLSATSFAIKGVKPPPAPPPRGYVPEAEVQESAVVAQLPSVDMSQREEFMRDDRVMKDAYVRYVKLKDANKNLDDRGYTALLQPPKPIFENDDPQNDANINAFRVCIKTIPNAANATFAVEARSTNPHKAKWLLESFVEAYREYERARNQDDLNNVIKDNEQRMQERREMLEATREEKKLLLETLAKKYGAQIIWEKGAERKDQERIDMRQRLGVVEKSLQQLESQIKETESLDPSKLMLVEGEKNKVGDLLNTLYDRRFNLQQELARLREDFTDRHPQVVKKLAELNSLNEQFPVLAREMIQNKLRELLRQRADDLSARKRLQNDIERVNSELDLMQANQQKFQEFSGKLEQYEKDIADLGRAVNSLRDRITAMGDPLEGGTARTGIPENVAPNLIYYVMIFGVLIGLVFAYVLEYLDDTIRTAHDVEKFIGLRVIGTVPMLGKGEEKLLHRIALKSPISEMMNTLSMILQSWLLKMKGQVLLIVSSKPGEGKSTFITNLAVALCRGGEKVVLIDSDLRKPSLHRFFGVDNSVGLSNYLEDSFGTEVEGSDEAKIAKIVHHTDVEGLFIIPSGPIPSNPVGLLKGENLERLLNHLKTYIGIILVDTPPLAMIDAGVLATKVDAVVTVMDAGKVTKREALAGKHLIENVGGNAVGVILNKVTLEGEEYYYYFEGYSYYYGSSRARKKRPV